MPAGLCEKPRLAGHADAIPGVGSWSTPPMQMASRHRIDVFWQTVFGTGDDGGEPLVTAHRCSGLAGYPGVYCVLRNEQVLISAPADLVGHIARAGVTAMTVTDSTWWGKQLPTWRTIGPSAHTFTDEQPPRVTMVTGIQIQTTAAKDLGELRASVPAAEWAESGFAGEDAVEAWRAINGDGLTVAAANLMPFDDVPADVGVLTHPRFRGQGIALAVASTAVQHAVRHQGIARWRALTTNTRSLTLAAKLGFEQDCVQLAIRPPTQS